MESNKQDYYNLTIKEIDSINEIDKTLQKIDNFHFHYGTVGFRYNMKKLEKLIYRAGIMTSILSMSKDGLPMGIMITGGNNKNVDNGIKISSENGQMISNEEEKYFEELINSDNLKEALNSIFSKLKPKQGKCIIIIGLDNRKSSKKLSEILIKGLKCIDNCTFNLYNIIPSPNLCFLTLLNQMNFQKIGLKYKMIFAPQDNYWLYLNNSFNKFHSYYNMVFKNKNKENESKYENEICIDCSNGIGSIYKKQIIQILSNKENNLELKINFINDNNIDKEINNNCGIKSLLENKIPINKKEKYPSIIKNITLSSDLDSSLYYIDNIKEKSGIEIIKGEKIIILCCKMLDFLINNFSKNLKIKYYEMVKMGIITSWYCNQEFISFYENNLKNNNYELRLVKTGIKILQKESKKFDISICYEYNGQGTIYISKELSIKFGKLSSLIETSKDSQIIELFQLFIALFNTTTSDGLANILVIESILKIMNLSINDVYKFYEDLPYKMVNIEVKDKNKFVTNEDDSKLLEPNDVKNKIDELVKKYEKCRVLIRPSGTEDCLRIYVETKTDENNCEIIKEIEKYLKEEDY